MNTNEFNSIMLSDHGALIIDDGDEHFIAHRAIVVREDTVIEEWKNEEGTDLVAFYGITSKVLYVTDPVLLVPGGNTGGKLELTSGSIWLIK